MRFNRIRLNGFKSFVDPTDLVIAEGLTGVVGPNGCGKSNLLEALRWVMGENRPTAMRGGGMEDVIFAGASTRPARNFAEVSLHLDNSDRLAPAGFNDLDTLDIVRRITRDAGSAYKVNSKDARARDVQMLFADASTGAHSPALVRQGQISELINAKPQNRRRVLEEAAGISGLYQRRHEAELKLRGAETNLSRVDDVIEQLAQQLASLARQAKQARRYREIAEELRHAEGLLLYLRWREAESGRTAAEADLAERTRAAAEAERIARGATGERARTEEALPALREEEAIAAAVLARLQLRATQLDEEEARAARTIETLDARIAQLSRDADRERELNADAGRTIEALTSEATRLETDGDGHDAALVAANADAHEAAKILQDRENALSQLTEDVARLAARHQSAERLLSDSRTTLARSEEAEAKARGEARTATDDLARAAQAFAAAQTALTTAGTAATAAETALAEADDAREAAQGKEAEARASRSSAEGESKALQAEVAALARLVDRDTAEGGQVMDLLSVKSGYEKAIGAALADDLRAPVIEGDAASGWAELPKYGAVQDLPTGVAALSNYVSVPPVLSRRLSQVGLVGRKDGARLQADLLPGQRLVSAEGDLWRWDGFRAGAGDAPSAAALRLEQLNRLQELKQDLEEAKARAEGASRAHEHLKARMETLSARVAETRDARRAADHALTEASRALSRSEADRNIAEGRRESAEMAARRHADEATAARSALTQAERAFADLDDLAALRATAEDVKMTVEAARMTMIARRSAHDELKREGEARAKRLADIGRERTTWEKRLESAGGRIAELAERQAQSEADLAEAKDLPARIAADRDALSSELDIAEARRAKAADALALAETAERDAKVAERDAERRASEAREHRAAAEARAEAARATVAAAAERIAEEQDTTPQKLLETLDADPGSMPSAEKIDTEVLRLRRNRDALGAVNLRAEEDAKAVEEEHNTLVTEKTDLEDAIRTLRNGINSLNKEGRERLLTAFEQVNSNFSLLFTHLFGGGEAKLVLVESDDPLEAGLEIMCQPPGKKLATLSLLSGGEQTLTALALIFGVFLANPAPICVLDEVDAPLDDANVTRFCDLLDEMCRRTETRFLIITHHAVTMARMDRLFGVTMAEQGVSQLVSVDLRKAEALVA
ncbi:chromosome segregation protein SMC [Silicimonas algicola]|uniref:Chromosome partition protein Smc n=1 Tax=Silicimonas algicola TaxID=1826607 RepID=A0A316G400_9RHOB|nr:chromosome segregation protein SMC [Silicimonas algicola]AZQ68613.1 chromosome segregation protein SMC [Silicimonas algicola]PWK55664.1 condensin subunit Smc [Silicimonas algicola]